MKKTYTLSLDIEVMSELQRKTKNVSELANNLFKAYIDMPEDEKLKTREQLKKLEEEKAIIQAEINGLKQEVEEERAKRRVLLA